MKNHTDGGGDCPPTDPYAEHYRRMVERGMMDELTMLAVCGTTYPQAPPVLHAPPARSLVPDPPTPADRSRWRQLLPGLWHDYIKPIVTQTLAWLVRYWWMGG